MIELIYGALLMSALCTASYVAGRRDGRRECEAKRVWEGPCEAAQLSSMMACNRCNLVWDMNDPEPPKCAPRSE